MTELISIIFIGLGFGIGWYLCRVKQRRRMAVAVRIKNSEIERFRNLYQVFYQWALIRGRNEKVSSFFIGNGIDHIAVYGYGLIGKMLVQELRESGITVDYAIDRNANGMSGDVPLIPPDGKLPPCSMVIVTVQEYVDIREMLTKKVVCPIVSILEVLETSEFRA